MENKEYFKDLTYSELEGLESFGDDPLLTKVREEMTRRIEETKSLESATN